MRSLLIFSVVVSACSPSGSNVGVTGTVSAQGTGTAGTPASGVLTVQGVTGGQALPMTLQPGAIVNVAGTVTTEGSGTPGAPMGGVASVQGVAGGQPLSVTLSGAGSVAINGTVATQGLGTAGAPTGGVVSVQGVSNGAPLPVSLSGGALSGTVPVQGVANGLPVAVSDTPHAQLLSCEGSSTGAAAALCAATGQPATGSLYVTDVVLGTDSALAAGGATLFLFAAPTGTCATVAAAGNCDRAHITAPLFHCSLFAGGQSSCNLSLRSPLKVALGNDVCFCNSASGAQSGFVSGFYGP